MVIYFGHLHFFGFFFFLFHLNFPLFHHDFIGVCARFVIFFLGGGVGDVSGNLAMEYTTLEISTSPRDMTLVLSHVHAHRMLIVQNAPCNTSID